MNMVDMLLVAGIALALILAVRKCIQNYKQGKNCNGNCAQCGRNCGK